MEKLLKEKNKLYGSATEIIIRNLAKQGIPQFLSKTFFHKAYTVVTYHGVTESPLPICDGCFVYKDSIIRQLLYIKKNFLTVRLSDAADIIASKRKTRQPILSLTFDDGFQNNFDVVFPILKELRLPATIFPVTGFVDSDRTIWYCMLNKAFSESKKKNLVWMHKTYELRSMKERTQACMKVQALLKKMPHTVLVQEVENITSLLGYRHPVKVSRKSPYRILSSSDISKMHKSGLVEFGAHTHTHSILSLLPDKEKEYEIKTSIDYIKDITGKPCGMFSYPNGEMSDFEEQSKKILTQNGISRAFSMMRGPNYSDTDPLCFHRYGIEGNMSFHKFIANVHHMVWMKRSILRFGKRMLGRDTEAGS